MTEIFRELETKQKSVTLYKDQTSKIERLLKKNPRAFQHFMRRAVDLAIEELEEIERNEK